MVSIIKKQLLKHLSRYLYDSVLNKPYLLFDMQLKIAPPLVKLKACYEHLYLVMIDLIHLSNDKDYF